MIYPGSLAQHSDLLLLIIMGCFMVISFFLVRTIQKIDKNQTELFYRLNKLSEEFHTLKGEHKAMIKIHEKQGG